MIAGSIECGAIVCTPARDIELDRVRLAGGGVGIEDRLAERTVAAVVGIVQSVKMESSVRSSINSTRGRSRKIVPLNTVRRRGSSPARNRRLDDGLRLTPPECPTEGLPGSESCSRAQMPLTTGLRSARPSFGRYSGGVR